MSIDLFLDLILDALVIGLCFYDCVSSLHQRDCVPGGVNMGSLCLVDQSSLGVKKIFASLPKTRKKHHKSHVLRADRNHWRDHSSFAVSDQPNHLWIDLFPLF